MDRQDPAASGIPFSAAGGRKAPSRPSAQVALTIIHTKMALVVGVQYGKLGPESLSEWPRGDIVNPTNFELLSPDP
jgi:hypothetical protein